MSKTDPCFQPSEIPGYVFFSNSPKVDYDTKIENTENSLKEYFAKRYNVPTEDILVMEMLPYDCVKFSVYFEKSHTAIKNALTNFLDAFLENEE